MQFAIPTPLVIALAALTLTLAACTSSVQTTSGADYLKGYDGSYAVQSGASGSDTDAAVRRVAAVEPNLKFPARIGLARIEHGQLAAVPEGEGQIWLNLV